MLVNRSVFITSYCYVCYLWNLLLRESHCHHGKLNKPIVKPLVSASYVSVFLLPMCVLSFFLLRTWKEIFVKTPTQLMPRIVTTSAPQRWAIKAISRLPRDVGKIISPHSDCTFKIPQIIYNLMPHTPNDKSKGKPPGCTMQKATVLFLGADFGVM